MAGFWKWLGFNNTEERSLEKRSLSTTSEASLKDVRALERLLGDLSLNATVTPRNAMGISAFFGCVRIISNLIAARPFGVHKELENGGGQRQRQHPLDYLLTIRPHRQMSPFMAIRTLVANAIVHGFSIATIKKNEYAQVTEIRPWPTQDVMVMEDLGTGMLFFQVLFNGTNIIYSEDEVIHLKDLSFDGRQGVSIVTWQKPTIKVNLLTSGFLEKYYEKGTFMAGFLTSPLSPKDEEAAKIYKQRVKDAFGAEGFAVLGSGMEWHNVSRSPVESQLMETFDKSKTDIATMFGVPLSLLGDTEKQTSWGTGVEQMFIGLTRSVLMPIAYQLEQEINYKCLTTRELKDGYYTHFDFKSLLEGGAVEHANYLRTMVNSGIINIDEARELLQMAPLKDGNGSRNMVQGAMVPIDKLDDIIDRKKNETKSNDGYGQTVPPADA